MAKINFKNHENFLRANGLRSTPLHNCFIDVLKKTDVPLRLNEIIHAVEKRIGKRDRVSFYRTIARLKERNLIVEAEGKRFLLSRNEGKLKTQITVSCLTCNRVQESSDDAQFSPLVEQISRSTELNKLQIVTLKGICNSCVKSEASKYEEAAI
jgi:Fe2+ or Zn2+ uptake regulation protein